MGFPLQNHEEGLTSRSNSVEAAPGTGRCYNGLYSVRVYDMLKAEDSMNETS